MKETKKVSRQRLSSTGCDMEREMDFSRQWSSRIWSLFLCSLVHRSESSLLVSSRAPGFATLFRKFSQALRLVSPEPLDLGPLSGVQCIISEHFDDRGVLDEVVLLADTNF